MNKICKSFIIKFFFSILVLGSAWIGFNYFRIPKIYWLANTTVSYNLRIFNKLKKNPLISDLPNSNSVFTGVLHLRIFDTNPNLIRIGFLFEDLEIKNTEWEGLEELLKYPILCSIKPNGHVLEWIFDNHISKKDEITILGILQVFSFELNPNIFFNSWENEEENTIGKFRAIYNYNPFKFINQIISKKKEKYISVNQGSNEEERLPVELHLKKSEGKIILDNSHGWAELINIQEEGSYKSPSGQDIVQYSLDAELKYSSELFLKDVSFNSKSFEMIKMDFAKKEKEVFSVQEQTQNQIIQEKYGKADLNSVVKYIKQVPANQTTSFNEIQPILDYLKLHPQEALKIGEMVVSSNLKDTEKTSLLLVLELNGSSYSQKALTGIASAIQLDKKFKINALISLGQIRGKATTDTVDFLENQYFSKEENSDSYMFKNVSILSLGKLAKSQKKYSTGESAKIVERIESRILSELGKLNPRSEPQELANVFHSIANTKNPNFVKIVEPHLRSTDGRFRNYAAESLKYIQSPEAAKLLKERLKDETDSNCRAAVYESLTAQEFDKKIIDNIKTDFKKEDSKNIRSSMIDYLIEKRKDYPDYKKDLEEALKSETDNGNKQTIYRALYTDFYERN